MPSAMPVLICGGGIGGLAAALSLAERGIASHVLERRAEPSEAGAGIQLSPNGVRVLERLGLTPQLAPLAGVPGELVVHDGVRGRVLQRLPLGAWIEARYAAPYWMVHRRDLHAALLARVRATRDIRMTTGFEANFYTTEGAALRLNQVSGGSGAFVEGCALIGADGQFSRVRQQLVAARRPAYSGWTAARTVIPAAALEDVLDPAIVGVWLAHNSHVVHYPVRQGREIAMVVVRAEASPGLGWSEPVEMETLVGQLAHLAPRLATAVRSGRDWQRWALYEAAPLPRWSVGAVTLLGDAAHPILPFLAQGGSLALEDAWTLAACVASRPGDTEAAFLAYEQARRQRTARVAAAARSNGRIFHLAGLPARARDLVLGLAQPARMMQRYDWLYGWRPE